MPSPLGALGWALGGTSDRQGLGRFAWPLVHWGHWDWPGVRRFALSSLHFPRERNSGVRVCMVQSALRWVSGLMAPTGMVRHLREGDKQGA